MRVMAYLGDGGPAARAVGCWLLRRKRLDTPGVPARRDLGRAPPFIMNTAGWMLTENGRQPWIVQGLHEDRGRDLAVGRARPRSGSACVVFVLLYLALGVIERRLMLRYARRGLARRADGAAPETPPSPPSPTEGLMCLDTVWFIVVAVLLDGVLRPRGLRLRRRRAAHAWSGRDERERRAALNTIGPFWDGNEVWLIVAGAAMFAAFPGWYATLFSGAVPGAAAAARRADRPRRRLRVRREGHARRAGGRPGRGRRRWAARAPAAARHRRSAACWPDSRSTPTANSPAAWPTCSRPTACGPG